jgi:hypothetical protein
MSERPLPRSWKERVRERLAEAAKQSSRLTVVPKRTSGPHICGDKWHLPPAQFQMNAEHEGLMSEKRCCDCGKKVIAATGNLIGTPGLCGPCAHRRLSADHPDRIPPSAA